VVNDLDEKVVDNGGAGTVSNAGSGARVGYLVKGGAFSTSVDD
jgi:hypothetical protein